MISDVKVIVNELLELPRALSLRTDEIHTGETQNINDYIIVTTLNTLMQTSLSISRCPSICECQRDGTILNLFNKFLEY